MLSVVISRIVILSAFILTIVVKYLYAGCCAESHFCECGYEVFCYAEGHYAECHNAECHYAECHYAECHYAESHYAECYYAECHYAECRGAKIIA
jgi:hypothetical protein